MLRIVLGGIAAAILLLLPATAQGDSAARVRGTVTAKSAPRHLVSIRSTRAAYALNVPGPLAAIRIGQHVELHGATLRRRGQGSRVLARNVTVVSLQSVSRSYDKEDEEVEITGTLTSLAPLTVSSRTQTVTCDVPTEMSLAGFAVGDTVEITCDLTSGVWVLRKLKHEGAEADDDQGQHSGPGTADDDDDDHGGTGVGEDDDDDDHGEHSGSGGGGDDDD